MQYIARDDVAGLRQFCFTLAAAIPLVFSALLPWLFDQPVSLIPVLLGAMMLLLGVFVPAASYRLYLGWMALARALGWINTRVILAAVFFGLIAPLGWLLRKTGKLQYTDRMNDSCDSYRVIVDREPTAKDLRRPF